MVPALRRARRSLGLAPLLLACLAPAAAPANDVLPEPIVRALAAQKIDAAGLSLFVQDVAAARPLVAFDADTPRNPASVMKLVTTLAGLELLGPAYQWRTRVYTDATLDDERLEGNLYLRGGGDPYLVTEVFWKILRTLRQSGIPGYRARIRPIVSRITIHWPSFYNVVTGKTLALPNLIALQHIPLSPAGVIAKRPAPIALPNSCAAEWRMAPDAVFSPYASVRYFTPHMVHSQYNLL